MVEITPEDIQRRQDLNRERNPRITIPNEATSTLNPIPFIDPITGIAKKVQQYDGGGFFWEFEELFSRDGNVYSKEPHISYFPGKEPIQKSTTTNFIEYQFALAQKDVRDGKMHPLEYKAARAKVRELVERMNKADVPLSALSSPDGLDNSLKAMAREVMSKFDDVIIHYSKPISNYSKRVN